MMRFHVFLSLWSVTSRLCIDKIYKAETIKVIYYIICKSILYYIIFSIKVKTCPRPPKTAHLNTCLRHGVGRFA